MTPLNLVAENICDLRKADRVIGFFLYDKFNESIARINAVLVDSKTYHCYYLLINLGGFLQVNGKDVVLPTEICEVKDLGKVQTEWRKESMLDAPTPIDVLKITTFEEGLIRDYYGLSTERPLSLSNQKQ